MRHSSIITFIAMVSIVFLVPCLASLAKADEQADEIPEVPTKGMVTLLDLGSDKCIPCKMMAPMLEELRKSYKGKVSIIFIDVWKHKKISRKFKVKAIPTQIFYDKNGKEVFRHTGYLGRESIVKQLGKMGVK